jgi:hypothetical protein
MTVTETSEQMDARLLHVIAHVRFDVFPDDYIYQPMLHSALFGACTIALAIG